MTRILSIAGLLALGIFVSAPGGVAEAAPVYYDAHGNPYVIVHNGKKQVRHYCRKGLYGAVQCPTPRSHLRYGPYDRDFAFSQGYQILR
jgi:hypothetical protein